MLKNMIYNITLFQIDDSESSQRERMISDISDDDDVVRLDDDDDIVRL